MKLIINKLKTSDSTKSMEKSYLNIFDVRTKAQTLFGLCMALIVEEGFTFLEEENYNVICFPNSSWR